MIISSAKVFSIKVRDDDAVKTKNKCVDKQDPPA